MRSDLRALNGFAGVGGAGALAYATMIPLVYPAQRSLAFRSSEPHAKAFPKYVATQLLGLQLSALLKFWTFARA
ncbi:hypothetical protein CCR94_20970 [Rhodoblastus sphagnicola]|uniref:DUF4149 domain-containing protein n=1 Tax=Rhodoblastus sphagnicola TaxID=333368 RepID=A0A2S6MX14_9HYPH|nr:hypothetical protein [Rhodoblastus sphagnicola]MBB4199227.1 hypothetical protein [Rhodoblastus sphagnicola]PPQ26900.1 hypothetical protein CCR94_20970 [Rhodoblastus sphagnicola]